VDNTPRQFGNSKQRLQTPEGYLIPISIRNGFPYIDMYPTSDKELDSYSHVHFKSDIHWNPQVLDDEYKAQDLELYEDDLASPSYHSEILNKYGEIHSYNRDDPGQLAYNHIVQKFSLANKHIVGANQHDFTRLAPYICFVPEERMERTIDNTTQFARMDTRLPLRKNFKSRFPDANISRLNEIVATDKFFFYVPAIDDGIMCHRGTKMLQLYCGCDSQLTDVYPMKKLVKYGRPP
jgi:hypothetical protein